MSVIQRYRKREPIEVEAVRLSIENIAEAAGWCGGMVIQATHDVPESQIVFGQPVGVKLLTKNRLQVALIGNYIYKDHEGYFHTVGLNEFLFEYEPIQGDEKVVAETKENKE